VTIEGPNTSTRVKIPQGLPTYEAIFRARVDKRHFTPAEDQTPGPWNTDQTIRVVHVPEKEKYSRGIETRQATEQRLQYEFEIAYAAYGKLLPSLEEQDLLRKYRNQIIDKRIEEEKREEAETQEAIRRKDEEARRKREEDEAELKQMRIDAEIELARSWKIQEEYARRIREETEYLTYPTPREEPNNEQRQKRWEKKQKPKNRGHGRRKNDSNKRKRRRKQRKKRRQNDRNKNEDSNRKKPREEKLRPEKKSVRGKNNKRNWLANVKPKGNDKKNSSEKSRRGKY
jgi:hypothetical protein